MPKFELTRARAITSEVLYAAGMPEDAEATEPFTRVYRYLEGAWEHSDVDLSTQRIARFERPEGGKIAVFMSHEGRLFSPEPSFHGCSIIDETLNATKRLGRLSDLRQIGRYLVACGDGGQTYRQTDSRAWIPLDPALFDEKVDSNWVFSIRAQGNTGAEEDAYWKAHPDQKAELDRRIDLMLKQTDLHAINGTSLDCLYICSKSGVIYFWNGQETQKIQTNSSSYLTDIIVDESDTVFVCGRDGSLLRGCAAKGFESIPCDGAPMFSKMTRFKDHIYLSSYANPRGAFVYDGRKIVEVTSGLRGGLRDVHTVDAVDNALWVVGSREVARFDGSAWERIALPE